MAITQTIGLYWRRRNKILIGVLSTLLIAATTDPAVASRNGVENTTNTFTIGITFKNSGIDEVCSGTLISPTFILTAAHCIVNEKGERHTDYVFTKPGSKLEDAINPVTAPKILQTYFPNDFVISQYMERNDAAFIQLDKPLATKGWIRIATADEVAALVDKQPLKGYGYGFVYETGAPYSNILREYVINWRSVADAAILKTVQVSSATATGCSGDSGGSITMKAADGSEILLGNLSGAANVVNHCGTQVADGNFYMQISIANQYLSLIQTELSKSLTPKPKLLKITCVKGKVKKYITGTNPKCPTGYKQTAKVLVK